MNLNYSLFCVLNDDDVVICDRLIDQLLATIFDPQKSKLAINEVRAK
jgi:hypothetical protein